MKFYYLITVFISLLFIGCSSTYTVSDFSSKEKFYADFNKFVTDMNVNIILKSDSLFTSSESAYIAENSLIFTSKTSIGSQKFPLRKVKKIEYINYQILSGNIILNNDETIYGENIKVLPDSSVQFIAYKDIKEHIPLGYVKKISYKNHWLGSLCFSGIGLGSGAVIGGIYQIIGSGFTIPIGAPEVVGISLGVIIGSITGGIIGYTYTYEFNP
jgi:hypothetical protein